MTPPVYVAMPMLQQSYEFELESGRRWNAVEHLIIQAICKKAQTINVPSFVGGSNALMLENTRQRMVFDHIYPNPSKYWVTLDIYSKDKQLAVIDFYNQQGQTIHRMEVEVKTCRNKVELDVSQWRSGSYYIIGRGNGTPAYGRFLKVWE